MYRPSYGRSSTEGGGGSNANKNAAAAASKKKAMMIGGVVCVVSSVVAAVVGYLLYKRSKSNSASSATDIGSLGATVPDAGLTLVPVNVTISPSPSLAPVAPVAPIATVAPVVVATVTKKPATEPAVGSCQCKWMQDAKVYVCSDCGGDSSKQEQPQTPPTLMTGVTLESQASPGMRPSANLQKLVKTGAPALKRSPGVCATNAYLISNGGLYLNETGGLLVWGKEATCWTVEQAGCGTGFYRLRSAEGLYLKALPGSNVLALVMRVSASDASSCWKL